MMGVGSRETTNGHTPELEADRLRKELALREMELAEKDAYLGAIGKVFSVIREAGHEAQPVLDAVVHAASELCQADFSQIFTLERGRFRVVALNNAAADYVEYVKANPPGLDMGSMVGRSALTKAPVHIPDVLTDPLYTRRQAQRMGRWRSMLGVPLMRDGQPIGVLALSRSYHQPFTQRQIELISTFADQAAIAVENAAVLKELRTRQDELAQSLEYQTATNDVLRTISRSEYDLEVVLQTSIDAAMRLCKAEMGSIFQLEGEAYRWRVGCGLDPAYEAIERENHIPPDNSTLVGRAALTGQAVHVHDAWTDVDYGPTDQARIGNIRTMLGVPLLRNGHPIGVFALARGRVEPFSEREISVVTTFADQAVIAIENVRLFKEIKDKSRELELASQHKSQFLANMSHELRTPLNAILGYTELMQDGIYGQLPRKASDVLARVQTNGKHLLGLINQVLDLSKIEAGQLKLNFGEYSLGGVIETIVAATESLATEKGLRLKAEIAGELPKGIGDEQRIVQVLLNLVGNAIKFTEKGEVRIRVGAFAGWYEIAVADTGPGISPEEIDRVFEEFHQGDSSNTKTKGGTGLGLAIAKRITELHGGRIWVESVPGHGATFKIELPVVAIEAQEQIARGAAE